MNLCFAKRQKLSVFWPCFWQFLVDVQKHYKNKYFSTCLKPNCKKWPVLMVTNWAIVFIFDNWPLKKQTWPS